MNNDLKSQLSHILLIFRQIYNFSGKSPTLRATFCIFYLHCKFLHSSFYIFNLFFVSLQRTINLQAPFLLGKFSGDCPVDSLVLIS